MGLSITCLTITGAKAINSRLKNTRAFKLRQYQSAAIFGMGALVPCIAWATDVALSPARALWQRKALTSSHFIRPGRKCYFLMISGTGFVMELAFSRAMCSLPEHWFPPAATLIRDAS